MSEFGDNLFMEADLHAGLVGEIAKARAGVDAAASAIMRKITATMAAKCYMCSGCYSLDCKRWGFAQCTS